MIRSHHEWFDGTGYPSGLAGEEIPLGARMLAIVDAYDAMTSSRPYRQAMTTDQALAEIRAGAGSQFDPALASLFVDMIQSGELVEQASLQDRSSESAEVR
jgi:putative two-component system response regulator